MTPYEEDGENPLLTVREVAALLRVGRDTALSEALPPLSTNACCGSNSSCGEAHTNSSCRGPWHARDAGGGHERPPPEDHGRIAARPHAVDVIAGDEQVAQRELDDR